MYDYRTDLERVIESLGRMIQEQAGSLRVSSLNVKIQRNGAIKATVQTESSLWISNRDHLKDA